jgi:hypothetical protein
MNKNLTTLIICFLIVVSLRLTAQVKPSPTEKFFEYYNAHDIMKLDHLLAENFVWNIRFLNKKITKKELLGPYMKFHIAFNEGYTTISVIVPGNPEIITVHEYSDKNRFLQLDDPGWSFLMESKNGKITSIVMDGLKGLDDYVADYLRKDQAFRDWVDRNHGAETTKKTDSDVKLYHELMESYGARTESDMPTAALEVTTENPAESVAVFEPNYGMPCTHFGKLTLKQRLASYPFDKAKNVMLVSFTDTTPYDSYDKNRKRIPSLKTIENYIKLDAASIDKLSDLLFNVGYDTNDMFVTEQTECRNLKNAIVFLDAKGEPFEYIGVYFGCDVMDKNHDKIKFPVTCDEKFTMLRKFFSERGIVVPTL